MTAPSLTQAPCCVERERRADFAASILFQREKDGRGERIRTSDSCVPNAVLYQAELHPDAAITPRDDLGNKREGTTRRAIDYEAISHLTVKPDR
jgi:hypothetical protein